MPKDALSNPAEFQTCEGLTSATSERVDGVASPPSIISDDFLTEPGPERPYGEIGDHLMIEPLREVEFIQIPGWLLKGSWRGTDTQSILSEGQVVQWPRTGVGGYIRSLGIHFLMDKPPSQTIVACHLCLPNQNLLNHHLSAALQ